MKSFFWGIKKGLGVGWYPYPKIGEPLDLLLDGIESNWR